MTFNVSYGYNCWFVWVTLYFSFLFYAAAGSGSANAQQAWRSSNGWFLFCPCVRIWMFVRSICFVEWRAILWDLEHTWILRCLDGAKNQLRQRRIVACRCYAMFILRLVTTVDIVSDDTSSIVLTIWVILDVFFGPLSQCVSLFSYVCTFTRVPTLRVESVMFLCSFEVQPPDIGSVHDGVWPHWLDPLGAGPSGQ